MKYLRLESTDPYLNLAIEEYLFESTDDDVFMLWQNDNTVVIGKNQNAHAEIREEYLEKQNIKIARRITGGGAVYHDLGNVNYTFISGSRESGIDFEHFTSPIIEALSTLGIKATLSGRNDLLINSKKISGNAQHTAHGRVLHHGTLLYDSDLSYLSSVLNVDEEKIKAKALKSTRSRVTNIKPFVKGNISTEEFISKIEQFVIDKFTPEIIEAPKNERIDELLKRNSSKEWIYPESEFLSAYNIYRKKKYDFGIVTLSIEMARDAIRKVKINGDFFEKKDVSEFEEKLIGCEYSKLDSFISSLNIGEYIHGMTTSEFLDLLRDN